MRRDVLRLKEKDVQRTTTEMLDLFGWLWTHFRPGLTKGGRWVTPLSGSPGWPDIAAVRGDRFLVLELKGDRGILSAEQKIWRDLLEAADVEYHLIKPKNLDELERILR